MKEEHPIPPRWAITFLRWYCRPALLEDLEGDLNEYFFRNVKSKGLAPARFIFILDVLKFLKPYTIRQPRFFNLLTHWIMITSYMKTSGRNLLRNKLFSTINIAGLAISMTVGLLILGMLSDLYSYDRFHEKYSRIYRVISLYRYKDHTDQNFSATTSLKAARAIEGAMAGPEAVAILHRGFDGDMRAGSTTIPLSGFWANASFFDVFSFSLIQGDPASALRNPFSIVLTETSARKLFGETDVVGRSVSDKDGAQYTITGVLKDIPRYSHLSFDMLVSLQTRLSPAQENKEEYQWMGMWDTWTYVVLPEGGDATHFQENLDRLAAIENKKNKDSGIRLALQPLSKIMIDKNLNNEIGPVMGETVVWIFSALAMVVLVSTCFNYSNLSIARSFTRSREVGIRKAIGALRSHVAFQFLTESVIISLLALVCAIGLFLLVRPFYLSMESSFQELLTLEITPRLGLIFFLFAVVTGLAAGIFPALYFSRFQPIHVLKNLVAGSLGRGWFTRRALIVFQYTLSIMLITGTLIIHKQYNHFLSYNLGFSTESVLNIKLQNNDPDLLIKQFEELPEVEQISKSLLITSIGNYWQTRLRPASNPLDSGYVNYNIIDEKYIPLHGHKLVAGTNFTPRPGPNVEQEVIVNEQVLKRFKIGQQDPSTAINEVVSVDGKDLRIVGVVKDFFYGRVTDPSAHEVILRYGQENLGFLNVKVHSNNWPSTYQKLERIWKSVDPVHPFEAKFYDDQLEESFQGIKATMKAAGFLAFLVICISSLGLLGMVVFTTETRVKEISIRKVLGATEPKLLFLLGRGFIVLLGLACCIALPATYLFFDVLLLPELNNHAPIGLSEMTLGVLAVLTIALVMIMAQTMKIARTNPANVLKTE